jgi:hypothetical protein
MSEMKKTKKETLFADTNHVGPTLLHVDGKGPCAQIAYKNRPGVYIQSLVVSTCPKCGGYLQTIPIPRQDVELFGILGKWRCINCGYIPSDNRYDKEGVKLDEGGAML